MNEWRNFDVELPPPDSTIQLVRYVHTSAEWPPLCYVTRVTSAQTVAPGFMQEAVDTFDDLPPRVTGESALWWRPVVVAV